MWANFHMHSNFCDGKGDLSEYIQEAKRLKMISLGFSSHAPIPFPTKWCMKFERLSEYLESINRLRKTNPDLDIYKGLEVDFIPGITSPNVYKDKLDYTVGSVHFVEILPDGTGWEIDGTHSSFLE